ncbi:hypothetical protein CTAYLR_003185 [Chrysophaeum taylorii]|uniref:C2H2-type domain-containing protein n=1 Tax=Chrysophaeum taylorii TaxID=2483200 RepID=A0AAD7XKP0_9STRA|nr:hypothetical protein CTAYLR_003185 [Chrysophaeum taylorii]
MSKRINDVEAEIARVEAELAALEEEEEEEEEEGDGDGDGGELVLRSLENERIAPLAASQLPAPRRKIRREFEPGTLERARALVERAPSSEKIKVPFACRLCAFRGESLEEFEKHRKSQLHRAASKLYKEASFCALCRVQCTSPVELERHVSSKKHTERASREGVAKPEPGV